MKRILSLLSILLIFSCNNAGVTETEVNAVQKVLNFYSGECLRHKGFEIINGVEKTNFELEMSKSELLELDSSNLKSHSGNIAYLFYSNLGEEKSNYDEIKVKINLANGKSEEFKYPDKELKEVESLDAQIKNINELIINKNYDNLVLEFDSSVNIKKKSIEELFNLLENQHGNISKIQFQGFEYAKTNNYGTLLVIKEAIVFEKINGTLLLIFNRENKKLISIEIP